MFLKLNSFLRASSLLCVSSLEFVKLFLKLLIHDVVHFCVSDEIWIYVFLKHLKVLPKDV